MWFQRRRFLEIDQSETRIACGGHVCLWKTNILLRTSLCIRHLLINGHAVFSWFIYEKLSDLAFPWNILFYLLVFSLSWNIREFYFRASNVTATIAKIKLPWKLPGLTVPFCLSKQQEFWVVPCFYHQSIDLNKPSDIDYNHLDSVKHDNSLTSSNTENKYSSPPLTRVPYLQWHRGLIRGVASLDVRQFASILLSQCIWNLAW
jgi:hypothetical protein